MWRNLSDGMKVPERTLPYLWAPWKSTAVAKGYCSTCPYLFIYWLPYHGNGSILASEPTMTVNDIPIVAFFKRLLDPFIIWGLLVALTWLYDQKFTGHYMALVIITFFISSYVYEQTNIYRNCYLVIEVKISSNEIACQYLVSFSFISQRDTLQWWYICLNFRSASVWSLPAIMMLSIFCPSRVNTEKSNFNIISPLKIVIHMARWINATIPWV